MSERVFLHVPVGPQRYFRVLFTGEGDPTQEEIELLISIITLIKPHFPPGGGDSHASPPQVPACGDSSTTTDQRGAR